MRKEKGITLITLVIMIIVLLILAGIAVTMLTGSNGILNQITKAKVENEKEEVKEKVKIEVWGSYNNDGTLNMDQLRKNLNKTLGVDLNEIEDIQDEDGDNNGIKFPLDGHEISVDNRGNVVVEGEALPKYVKPGIIVEETKKDNYKDEDGEIATIPGGFSVSEEESNVEKGLVIVEAEDKSEFIWVPVENPVASSEEEAQNTKAMAIKKGDNYKGILYTFNKLSSTVIKGCTTGTSSYSEPIFLSIDSTASNNVGMTAQGLQDEFDAMMRSVEKYGGFYVGRYETSYDGKKVASKKGVMPMNATASSGNTWYGMYDKQKKFASSLGIDDKVGSSMSWGSQFDAMMNWFIKGGQSAKLIEPIPVHPQTITGSTETDMIYEVYDLGNNVRDWSLDGYSTTLRVKRGGDEDSPSYPSERTQAEPTYNGEHGGSRLTLYIK